VDRRPARGCYPWSSRKRTIAPAGPPPGGSIRLETVSGAKSIMAGWRAVDKHRGSSIENSAWRKCRDAGRCGNPTIREFQSCKNEMETEEPHDTSQAFQLNDPPPVIAVVVILLEKVCHATLPLRLSCPHTARRERKYLHLVSIGGSVFNRQSGIHPSSNPRTTEESLFLRGVNSGPCIIAMRFSFHGNEKDSP
jgi:hypothetical protein